MYDSPEEPPQLCSRCKRVPDELLRAIQAGKRDDRSVVAVLEQIESVYASGGTVCYEHQKKVGGTAGLQVKRLNARTLTDRLMAIHDSRQQDVLR